MKNLIGRKLTLLGLSALGATMSFGQPLFAQETSAERNETTGPAHKENRDEEFGPRREGRGGRNRDGEMRRRGPGRGDEMGGRGGRGRGGEEMRGGPRGAERGGHMRGRGGAANGDLLGMLSREFDLTPAQRNQISPIAETARRQIEALPEDAASQTNRRAQVAEIMESTQTKIRPILTPEQRVQLDAAKTNRLDGRGGEFEGRPRGRGGEFRGRGDREGRGPRPERNFEDDERGGPPRRGEFGGRSPRGGRGFEDDGRGGPPPRGEFGPRGPREDGEFAPRGPRRGGRDLEGRDFEPGQRGARGPRDNRPDDDSRYDDEE